MFIASVIPADGTPRAAVAEHKNPRYRVETLEEAKDIVEQRAKAEPTIPFTAYVVDEESMRIVAWTKYSPKPIVDWVDPSAMELERIAKL